MAHTIIGIMGPGKATPAQLRTAYALGEAIARQGWILLTGGRGVGVMDAACRGAKAAGGLTIGILPGDTPDNLSPGVDIPILTGLGSARNNINVLSSQVVVACGMGAGTASEVALALKAGRAVILLDVPPAAQVFFQDLSDGSVFCLQGAEAAIQQIYQLLANQCVLN